MHTPKHLFQVSDLHVQDVHVVSCATDVHLQPWNTDFQRCEPLLRI